MLYRATVEQVISPYKYRIRIPAFHKGNNSVGYTPNPQLPEAVACVPHGVRVAIQVDDVVIVSFEENNLNKPIILGLLFRSGLENSRADMSATSLDVISYAKLPSDTQIGKVTAQQIQYLQGLTKNVQSQLDELNTRIKNIEQYGCNAPKYILDKINEKFSNIDTGWGDS